MARGLSQAMNEGPANVSAHSRSMSCGWNRVMGGATMLISEALPRRGPSCACLASAYVGQSMKLDCALLLLDPSVGVLFATVLGPRLDGGGLEERKRDAGCKTDRPRKQNRFPDEFATAWSFPRIAGSGPSSPQGTVPALNPRATCSTSAIPAAGHPSRNN